MNTIVVLGSGRVARALSVALEQAQFEVRRWSRKGGGAIPEGDVVVLAVSDRAIAELAARVAREASSPPLLLHCSGALPAEECLGGLCHPTLGIGVLHPLLALAGNAQDPDFAGAIFAVEGDEKGRAAARCIALAVGGRPLELDRRALTRYHAAAVLVGNHCFGLVHAAVDLLTSLGLDRNEAEGALSGLYSSTARNLAGLGLERGLTGPIVRGDAPVVERHLTSLASEPHLDELYRVTAREVVKIARRRGTTDAAALTQIEQLLARDK
jgi:predicted short-subunit dehydrogenase-like oxidoreductase (DUF2520 family)